MGYRADNPLHTGPVTRAMRVNNRRARRDAKREAGDLGWQKAGDWFSDAFGIGAGDSFGVADDTGRYTGRFGTGAGNPDFNPSTGTTTDPAFTGLSQAEIDAIFSNAGIDSASAFQGMNDLIGNSTDGTGLYGMINSMPSFTEWLQQQGLTQGDTSGMIDKVEGLSDQLAGLDPDSPEAQAYAASLAGFEDITNPDGSVTTAWEQRQEFMQGLMDSMSQNMQAAGQEIVTGTQAAAIRRNTAAMEERAARMIADSMSETGSMGRMMMKADESLNQIANAEVQQQAQFAADNKNMALKQYELLKQTYDQQLENGQISTIEYVDAKRLALGDAISGYSTAMQAILDQNADYLQTYQADYDNLMNQIQLSFQAIQLEMGVTMAELQYASDLALQALAPYYTAADLALLADAFTLDFSDILDMISTAADIIGAL